MSSLIISDINDGCPLIVICETLVCNMTWSASAVVTCSLAYSILNSLNCVLNEVSRSMLNSHHTDRLLNSQHMEMMPCMIYELCYSLQTNWEEVVDSFDDMNLHEDLLRGIYAYGFEKPSAIQQRAIAPCIKGDDFNF